MIITEATKIGAIIKSDPKAIDVLVLVSPHFVKLKNPILRKILAPRVTVAEAARIGHCTVDNILNNLAQIGFEVGHSNELIENNSVGGPVADEIINHDASIDVRNELANESDPFNSIMKKLSTIEAGKTLLLLNSFEPSPLIRILKEKGHKIVVSAKQQDLVYTYITKAAGNKSQKNKDDAPSKADEPFESVLKRYNGNFVELDVRTMEMPKPMITILDHLQYLKGGSALLVHHKKIPVFLLPELEEKNFKCVFEQTDSEVLLIIFHATDAR